MYYKGTRLPCGPEGFLLPDTCFWTIFGLVLGNFWGPDWAQDRPSGAKTDPRRPSKVSKYRKPAFAKSLIFTWKLYFSTFGSSKDDQGRPKKALKRPLKSSKTQKRNPNMGPNLIMLEVTSEPFFRIFGATNCPTGVKQSIKNRTSSGTRLHHLLKGFRNRQNRK